MKYDNTAHPLSTDGQVLNSHGGHILFHDGYYYLYGEDRRAGLKVSVYRSKDLQEWEYRGTALSIDSPVVGHHLTRNDRRLRNPLLDPGKTWNIGVTIERPKVIYNEKTGKFVMWMHFEDGNNYLCAHAAVASCDTPDGAFVYHGSFRPCGEMSRDCTLFKDDDGTAYFISASRDNADLHIYRLAGDYLSIDVMITSIFPQQFREAPALFKRNGIYFMISSECTGWEPNQGRYSWATQIAGPWADHRPFGNPTTYDTQPAFVFEICGTEETQYMYVGDRWDPTDYFNSRYIMLPFTFPSDTELAMDWSDEVDVDTVTGTVRTACTEPGLVRIENRQTVEYLEVPKGTTPGSQIACQRLAYQNTAMMFCLQPAGNGKVRIISYDSGLALASYSHMVIAVDPDENDASQLWSVEDRPEGLKVIRAHDGRVMGVLGGEHSHCTIDIQEEGAYFDTEWGHSPQGFIIAPLYGQKL